MNTFLRVLTIFLQIRYIRYIYLQNMRSADLIVLTPGVITELFGVKRPKFVCIYIAAL